MVGPGGHEWLLRGAGACMVAPGGACVVAPRGACMVAAGGGHVWDTTRYGDTINERAVRILLECILVLICTRVQKRHEKYVDIRHMVT